MTSEDDDQENVDITLERGGVHVAKLRTRMFPVVFGADSFRLIGDANTGDPGFMWLAIRTSVSNGHGTYFAARWYAPSPGAGPLATDRPARYRRFLAAFEKERQAAMEVNRPLDWARESLTRRVIGPSPLE